MGSGYRTGWDGRPHLNRMRRAVWKGVRAANAAARREAQTPVSAPKLAPDRAAEVLADVRKAARTVHTNEYDAIAMVVGLRNGLSESDLDELAARGLLDPHKLDAALAARRAWLRN